MKPLIQAIAFLAAGKLLFACQDVIIKEMSGAYPLHQIMVIRGLASIPLLGERVGIRRFISIVIGFAGVLIVLRPDTNGFGMMSILPIVAALFYACCQLMVRVGRNTDPVSVMTLYASFAFVGLGSVIGLAFSLIEAPADSQPSTQFLLMPWALPQSWDWLFLILTGVTSGIGFMLSSSAYRAEEASKVAPFEYVMMIWVVILSYLVWSEVPDFYTMLGVFIIVLSGVYVMQREKSVHAKAAAYSGLTRR